MIRQLQLAFPSAKIHVVELSWTASLPDHEMKNLKHIVQLIWLKKENSNNNPQDQYSIHWTNITANR